MTTFNTLSIFYDGPFLWCKLNRPDVRNAFNPEMISELAAVPHEITQQTRAIVLCGEGPVFSAGGDLKWMKESLNLSLDENRGDAKRLAEMLFALDHLPVPLVGMIHGAAMGGGLGLVSVCDYVIAEAGTIFSFSEARLGIIPACIAPFVLRKIGSGHARSLFISAERFDSSKAFEIGLVHKIASGKEELMQITKRKLDEIAECSPAAVRSAKELIFTLENIDPSQELDYVANQLAEIRISPEGQEGLKSFLEKRKPAWSLRSS